MKLPTCNYFKEFRFLNQFITTLLVDLFSISVKIKFYEYKFCVSKTWKLWNNCVQKELITLKRVHCLHFPKKRLVDSIHKFPSHEYVAWSWGRHVARKQRPITFPVKHSYHSVNARDRVGLMAKGAEFYNRQWRRDLNEIQYFFLFAWSVQFRNVVRRSRINMMHWMSTS